MVSIYKKENERTAVVDGKAVDYVTVELRGLSTDAQPTEIDGKKIDNGSMWIEMDTGLIFFYDLENEVWGLFPNGE